MAGLTLKDLRAPNRARIQVLIQKLVHPELSPFTTMNGAVVPLNRIAFTEAGRITEFRNPADPAQQDQIIRKLKTVSRSNFVILYNDKDKFQLNELMKTSEFGGSAGKANRGDMAELIFSAAIAMRFMNKNQPVEEADVIKLLNLIDGNRPQQEMMFKSQNRNGKIVDDVKWEIATTSLNVKAINNPKVQSTVGDLIQASVKYANSSTVTKWSKTLYENDRYNMIQVQSIGTLAQKSTKVDVKVMIDKKPCDINVSLKADEVKQFGQVGGSGFDKQEYLWMKLMDMNCTKYQTDYFDAVKVKNSPIAGIEVVYKKMVTDINSKMSSNRAKVLDDLADGINFFATSNEPSVSLVQLSRQEAYVYKFDNLRSLLSMSGAKLKAVYAGKTYPQVDIVDEKGKVLVSVRCKSERGGTYIRNYIEKGKLLTELASFLAG